MSTPHQAHNIPWSLLVSNLAFIRPSPQRPEQNVAEISALRKANQASDIGHFARRFAAAIREFAATDRGKYPEKIKLAELEDGKVLPDSFLDKSLGYRSTITPEVQTVVYWDELGKHDRVPDEGGHSDLLKTLYLPKHPYITNLLFLAQSSSGVLRKLRHVTYSNFFHYGTDRVYQNALMAYILLNVSISMDLYGSKFEPSNAFLRTKGFVTGIQDYDAEMAPHQAFLGPGNDRLQDLPRFKQYLKDCFWQLYVCEMILREMDGKKAREEKREPKGLDWEKEVMECLSSMFTGIDWPPLED
ncbi:hypothetical protein DACRYDRAFT_103667 [Dacryopinax primogenitus]|uniref:Uncharacterized protein n=1 Tax=Dacryopinax primogenitus (strain DJM 731) TaxID=1858805 RepID=M5GE87_DACPD|nr:uncharacterized protein DACRYDRAFT_103667 [Dacryopinax primogenitus]EJU05172.1 hypothetical protein DACRYDRAFT_103667 [Dacryopinax primogenitus]